MLWGARRSRPEARVHRRLVYIHIYIHTIYDCITYTHSTISRPDARVHRRDVCRLDPAPRATSHAQPCGIHTRQRLQGAVKWNEGAMPCWCVWATDRGQGAGCRRDMISRLRMTASSTSSIQLGLGLGLGFEAEDDYLQHIQHRGQVGEPKTRRVHSKQRQLP